MLERSQVFVSSVPNDTSQIVRIGPHKFQCDEPRLHGGRDRGPAPIELACGALGADLSMTIANYARANSWPVDKIEVAVAHGQGPREMRDGTTRITAHFDCQVRIQGALSHAQRQTLVEVARACPLQDALGGECEVRTRLSFAAAKLQPTRRAPEAARDSS